MRRACQFNHLFGVRLAVLVLVAAVALSVVIGCSPGGSSPTAAVITGTGTPDAGLRKTKDGLTITLRLDPVPLKPGVPTHFVITITDEKNQPVTDATVKLSLSMAGMNMGKNEPKVEPAADAGYTATGTFSMGGNTWFADVQITRGDKLTEVLFSNLDVRE